MADINAESTMTAGGLKFKWVLDYDEVATSLTLDVTQVDADTGVPVAPQQGEAGGITVTRQNGVQRSFDFFALGFVNAGVPTFPGLALRIGNGRSRGFELTSWFNPAR